MKFLSDILAKAGLTVDGVVTLNNTATGQTPATNDNSTKLATTAFIKNQSYLSANQTITVSGDATGSGTTSIVLTLANSGVTAGVYGNASNIPTITVDAKGRITSISTNAVSIITTLAGLSDVTLTSPSANQVLQYNGTQWVNGAAPVTYTLPIATSSILGGIKVGSGLSIDAATGILSASGASGSASIKSTQTFTATAGQTVFTISGGYAVGLIDVFLNGVYLSPNQTTATNGTTVTLAEAAIVNDIIDVIIASPVYQGATTTTDQLSEGSTNLYFTNARVLSALSGRTLTINGTAYNLSADRTWSVGTVTSVAALTIGTSGTDISSSVATGTTTPVITLNIPDASASARGVVTTSSQTFAGAKAFASTVAINNTSPYDTAQFSLDINGGLVIKNINKTAQIVLINANPASGGNNAFVVHTVGGTLGSSYADIQGYYGTSITGSTVIRLNPLGGNVLIGSLIGTGTRMVVASSTGVLSTQSIVTLGDLSGVSTARTITINGTTQDLSADRTFTINSMVYPGAGIAVSTGTAWGTSLTDNSANWNTAFGWGNHAGLYSLLNHTHTFASLTSKPTTLVGYGITDAATSAQGTSADTAYGWGNHAIAGYLTGITSGQVTTALGYTPYNATNPTGYITSAALSTYATQSYVGTQIANLVASSPAALDTLNELAAALGNDAAFSTTVSTALGNRLRVDINTQGLSATLQGYGRTNLGLGTAATSATGDFAAASHTHSIADVTGLQTALDGKQASGSYAAATHSHIISDVTGLQTALDGKQASLGFTPYNSTNPSGYITSSGSISGNAATATNVAYSGLTGTVPTWNQNTTGTAGSISGFNNPTTSPTANTIMYRDGSGYVQAVYYYSSNAGRETTGINSLTGKVSAGAGYMYEFTAAAVQTFLGLGSLAYSSATIPTNNNQLTNGAGYITSYSETDTLASVTGRGNTTTSSMAIGSGSIPNGKLYVNSGSGSDVVALQNTLNTGAYLVFADTVTPTWANAPRLGAISNDMVFKTLDTERFRIASTGASTFTGPLTINTTGDIVANGDTFRMKGGGGSAEFIWYRNYSGSPSEPGFNINNRAGVTTFSHNVNGGGTSVSGNFSAANFSGSSSGTNTGDQTNISGNAATATTATYASYLNALTNYSWTSSSLPNTYHQGITSAFVGPGAGEGSWQDYGSVMTMRTYGGGGGSLQLYTPYGPSNGGNSLQVRFGNYNVSSGNSWTGWKTLIDSGSISSQSVSYATTAGSLTSMNISQFTNNSGYVTTSGLSTDSDSEQIIGGRIHYFNSGAGRMNADPRWNESGYDADLGCLHLWSWTAAGVAYGRAGIAFYSGSAYQYLTTKSGESNLYVNNNAIIHAGNYTSYVYSQATSNSIYSRKDTTSQWMKPYYEYGNYLTTEAPSTLTSQMGGGGLRVDFAGSTYSADGSWSHVITFSGYNRYSMSQIGTNYNTTDARLYYRQTNGHTDAWLSWKEFVFTSGNTPLLTMSGPIRRSTSLAAWFEGTYNNVGDNSGKSNPIYTIGSAYNPADASLSNMYGVGYAHPNFWGSGKVAGWGMYVASAGVFDVILGGDGASTSIWAKTDIVAYSDARVKENVEVIENALEKVQAIRGVTFTRNDVKDTTKRSTGVIAQEVLKVLPEVVSGTEKDMYSVAYGNMAGLFIEAIKEQQTQIESQKSEIDELKDLVQQLINR